MSVDELLSNFEEHLQEFERFQGYVDKARELADKYTDHVVEKVVSEFEEKKLEVVGAIMLLQSDLESALADAESQCGSIEEARANAVLGIEELDLRLAIGDLDDASYARESHPFKVEEEQASQQLEEAKAEADALGTALRRWEEVGTRAGVLQAA